MTSVVSIIILRKAVKKNSVEISLMENDYK